jgi:hypothetical protein
VASSWELETRRRRKIRKKRKRKTGIRTRKKTRKRIARLMGTRLPSRSEKDAFQSLITKNLFPTRLGGPLSSRTFSFMGYQSSDLVHARRTKPRIPI